ncbi:MAG: hypothetical protein HY655_04485 [Acidobacteria bacterium]|nr:hypothetical protein [Acidobacteriota bacterium]
MSTMGLLVITLLSAALAAVMSAIAWRVARQERLRAEARIATLAAEIHAEPVESTRPAPAAAPASWPEIAIRAEAPRRRERPARTPAPQPRMGLIHDLPLRDTSLTNDPVMEPQHFVTPASSSPFRFATVGAIGVFVVCSVAALAVLVSPGTETAPRGPVPAPAPADAAVQTQPLELMALGHERFGDGLTVRGVVRNPESGTAVDRLAAVVFVFNREGEFVVSARATVGARALDPGDESRFVVAIPNASDVSRYRVSFRADQRVLPHVDKREPGTVARMQ